MSKKDYQGICVQPPQDDLSSILKSLIGDLTLEVSGASVGTGSLNLVYPGGEGLLEYLQEELRKKLRRYQ